MWLTWWSRWLTKHCRGRRDQTVWSQNILWYQALEFTAFTDTASVPFSVNYTVYIIFCVNVLAGWLVSRNGKRRHVKLTEVFVDVLTCFALVREEQTGLAEWLVFWEAILTFVTSTLTAKRIRKCSECIWQHINNVISQEWILSLVQLYRKRKYCIPILQ